MWKTTELSLPPLASLLLRIQTLILARFTTSLRRDRYLMLAVRLMFTVQLGTPRGRYDEYSSKVFPQ
jgi:hypothetical protein